jgi:ribosomal protein S18 acetylase RimI-like enzyme
VRPLSPSSRNILVRRFNAADTTFVRKLSEVAFGEYASGSGAHVLELIQRPGVKSWVACEDEEPAGFVLLGRDQGDWSIPAIAVAAQARGRGIGSKLLGVAEREARTSGASLLWLVTADSNLSALDLFLRHGFRIVARRRRFYERGQDACRMEKQLPHGKR